MTDTPAPTELRHARTYPVAAEDAFTTFVPLPLPEVFRRRYGPLPPIAEVRDQTGPWEAVGASRTIVLAGPGGGTMREELTAYDPPRSFGYELTELTGPLKPLVERIEGRWAFDPAGTGVRITWTWTVHPASPWAARAMPAFARLWQGYAARAFADLEALLVRD